MAVEGIVYLVGAGPGEPDLITVRGLQLLRRADVVIYDRLVNRALLEEVPDRAERIYAGKRPGRQVLRQDEINRLLIDRASRGLTVVRLKGGDPFVFGRGGEEALACAEAGIRWEVVPGISSAIGVPAHAAIPVTCRQIAGNFAVVTAHRSSEADGFDWSALARIDTLVILMGVGEIPRIVTQLLAHGKPADTPVAIIERGSQPDQRVVVATLEHLEERAVQAQVRPPATIVVGAVVALREALLRVAPSRWCSVDNVPPPVMGSVLSQV